MVSQRLWALRAGRVTITAETPLHHLLQEKIDLVAVVLVLACRDGLKYLSLRTLRFLSHLTSVLKMWVIRLEKKFSKIIDLIKGKNVTSRKGAISFFLKEIEDHKVRTKVKVSL